MPHPCQHCCCRTLLGGVEAAHAQHASTAAATSTTVPRVPHWRAQARPVQLGLHLSPVEQHLTAARAPCVCACQFYDGRLYETDDSGR